MQRAILVLSKNASLIEIIRSNLEEGGRYYVQGVTSVHGALAMVRHRSFDLVILDLEQTDPSATQMIHNLKAIQPEIKVLVYDHNDAALMEAMKTVSVDGFLARPFFGPELSDQLKSLFAVTDEPKKETSSQDRTILHPEIFMQDPGTDLGEISSLLERTSATAAMSFVQGKPASRTNSMDTIIAQKISGMISSISPNFKGCDFCRFVKSEDGLDACLVYVMPITSEVILAFTYPAGSDLRTIRQETIHLRDAFMIGRFSGQNADPGSSLQLPIEDNEFQPVDSTFMDEADAPYRPSPGERGSQWVLEMDENPEEPLPPALEEIIKSHPPVEPDLVDDFSLSDTQPIRSRAVLSLEEVGQLTDDAASTAPLPELTAAIEEDLRDVQENASEVIPVDTSISLPWEEEPAPSTEKPAPPPAENVLTAAMAAQDAISRELPQPRKSCNTYHCVLLPQSPGQLLTRELGEKAASIIRRHHQMNGWQLTHMTIRPQYAMWTVSLPVSIDPVKVVEDIKSETSELLLSSRPDEMSVVDESSFWASGYWILSGQHPPSGSLIRQFLNFNNRKSAEPQEPAI